MIFSMTAYACIDFDFKQVIYTAELKALNSKGLDIAFKSSPIFRSLEGPIKSLLQSQMNRGKIELTIFPAKSVENNQLWLNEPLIIERYLALKKIADQLNLTDHTSLLLYALEHSREFVNTDMISQSDEAAILTVIQQLAHEANAYRTREGATIASDLIQWIDEIVTLKEAIEKLDKTRIEEKRQRILKFYEEYASPNMSMDPARFEQELIYYIEKLDVSEELSRLSHHIDLYRATIDQSEPSGKKLGFIAQEIGREINTLGSKANNHEMQHLVVSMKDYLERIKEQLGNVV